MLRGASHAPRIGNATSRVGTTGAAAAADCRSHDNAEHATQSKIDENATMSEPRFRAITPDDDADVAELIREVMTEFDCVGEGFAIVDPEVDAMAAAYSGVAMGFYVVEDDQGIGGCGGYAQLVGTATDQHTCELRKMYFRPRLRGRGVGARFLSFLLEQMRTAGFATCYLETTTQMEAARRLYLRHGFVERGTPCGETGHGGCDRYFARSLLESSSRHG